MQRRDRKREVGAAPGGSRLVADRRTKEPGDRGRIVHNAAGAIHASTDSHDLARSHARGERATVRAGLERFAPCKDLTERVEIDHPSIVLATPIVVGAIAVRVDDSGRCAGP
jgi:hypothetical protein